MPDSPVKETDAADRRIFECTDNPEAQMARTPLVISREATKGRMTGVSIKSRNSARIENRMTYPPTRVRMEKLSMMEVLTEPVNEAEALSKPGLVLGREVIRS